MVVPDDKWRGMMIDFETLDTVPTAVLLSVGTVVFSKTEVLDKDYREFSVAPQIAYGRTVSRDTQEWWSRQNPGELERLLEEGKYSVSHYLETMVDLWEDYQCNSVWSRHSMDLDIIENLCTPPWRFYHKKNVATFDDLGTMSTNSHNALEDALNQVEFVQRIIGEHNANLSVPV